MIEKNISKIYLLGVPLEPDYKHTLYFSNLNAQESYFKSKIKHEFTNFTYQRKDGYIDIPIHYDKMTLCNYVMYQNSYFTNKWFYAFIMSKEYINDNCTRIRIMTDVIQTWLFTYNVRPSFIEREHCYTDSIIDHTLPEGLETGEYVCLLHEFDPGVEEAISELSLVMGTTAIPNTADAKSSGAGSGRYNGIYSGVKYYAYDNTNDLNSDLANMAAAGKSDAITGIFLAPKVMTSGTSVSGIKGRAISDSSSSHVVTNVVRLNEPESRNNNDSLGTIDGYNPRNLKLFTYPYAYLLLSNNNGGSAIYRYEDFRMGKCEFETHMCLTPGCSIRTIPKYYKSTTVYEEEGLNLGKFPVCNFASDMYTNWLTQNSMNIAIANEKASYQKTMGSLQNSLNAANSLISGIGSMMSGDIGGGISAFGSSGLNYAMNSYANQKDYDFAIKEINAEKYAASLVPPQAKGNLNAGDVVTAMHSNGFHYYHMTIKAEYARVIDDFFDMFGYQTNRVKNPEFNHRENYWYIKTQNVNIDGNIPDDDMSIIKNCYNTGITFWRKPENIGNYSVDNSPINGL